ncbi:MAG: helix-turn-helix domain-containing protein [Bacteroidales bacterium]|nr:helix-turn-helix domain-containing protein [Bacteroidales bacterium]
MKDRIRKLLEIKKESPSDFAQKLGVQRSSVSHIMSGRNNPGLDFLQKILTSYPDINPDWLLLGKGEIFRKPLDNDDIHETPRARSEDPVEYKSEKQQTPEKVIVLFSDGTFRFYGSSDFL